MFQLHDNFLAYDKNMQPYSFFVERHTETENLHAGITQEGFSLKTIGNRFILNTPSFTHASFCMDFRISYLDVNNAVFWIIFQYNEMYRYGKCIQVQYDLSGKIIFSLLEIRDGRRYRISDEISHPVKLNEDAFYPFYLVLSDGMVEGGIDVMRFSFPCKNGKGKLALERDNFLGELILRQLSFVSEDEMEQTPLYDHTFTIPCLNGGDIPYTISCRIEEIEGEKYLYSTLAGGTSTRKFDPWSRAGQYAAEKDFMYTPYVGITNGSADVRYIISCGENIFFDPNGNWIRVLKKYWGAKGDLPYCNTFKLGKIDLTDETEILFGYENLICNPYASQIGGSEFRFNLAGDLLYSGAALDGNDIYEIFSPFDKFAMSLIPEDCYNREEVEEHVKYNHFFDIDEDLRFTLSMCTRSETAYFQIKAAVWNVYETKKLAESSAQMQVNAWYKDYREVQADVQFDNPGVGVYKIEFLVYYGDQLYKRILKVFEVFNKDTDECPPLVSGLPFILSMPNEIKWLMRNSFDMWAPNHSTNGQHYLACATDTMIEAAVRESWKVNKKFKRSWFAMRTYRTANDYCSDKYNYVAENADYMFFSPLDVGKYLGWEQPIMIRTDYWKADTTFARIPEEKEILDSFCHLHPEIAEEIGYVPGGEGITAQQYENLMKLHMREWVDYANTETLKITEKVNADLRAVNPNIKRSHWGPIPVYGHPTLSYHSLQYVGVPCNSSLSTSVFDGFCVFEDYPYACSYQTHRGAFAAMTILLHCPGLKLYPEQYDSSRGGCVDGYVKFANPPFGAYKAESYQLSTQAFEYVYNTAHRLADGYHYWSTYGYHRWDFSDTIMDQLVLDWKYVVENKPAKPMRSIAYLAEYSNDEDVFESRFTTHGQDSWKIMNQSESGHAFVHECSRESGIPHGFALKFDVLEDLCAEECDILVLPSLRNAEEKHICAIRRLYEEGVNLIAVSDVTGLEDLFGVTENPEIVQIHTLSYEGNDENVYPMETQFKYTSNGAAALLLADQNTPAILYTKRTALINARVEYLGGSVPYHAAGEKSLYFVSQILRKAGKDMVRLLSNPLVSGNDIGLTLFDTEDGRHMLLAMDYTAFDNQKHDARQVIVQIHMDGVTDIRSDWTVFTGKKNGCVRELRFDIRPHESVFMELVTDKNA